MKDCEICEYINCPYFNYYKSIGLLDRCYAIGPCVKIRDQLERWRRFPITRPGVHFTKEQRCLIAALAHNDSYAAQSVIIAKIAATLNDLNDTYAIDTKESISRLEKALKL